MSEKTNKAVAKRFKITKGGKGKLLRSKPGFHHFRRRKSVKQKRQARQDQGIGEGFDKKLKCLILG